MEQILDELFSDLVNLEEQEQPSSALNMEDSYLDLQILNEPSAFDILPENDLAEALFDSGLNDDDLALINNPDSFQLNILDDMNEDTSTLQEIINFFDVGAPDIVCQASGISSISPRNSQDNGIDHSILAKDSTSVRKKNRKTSSVGQRNLKARNRTSAVGPAKVENDEELKEEGKIVILSQPRETFRPRTENESKLASHFIRCSEGAQFEYPTILIKESWKNSPFPNYLSVSLVDLQNQSHVYTLGNKNCENGFSTEAKIFRLDKQFQIFFLITEEDFQRGTKSLQIEFIKSRQSDFITKKLISERKLDQSKLCFTRWTLQKNSLHEDLESTVYSNVMKEMYGEVSIEQLTPNFGPISGSDVWVSTKGRFNVDEVKIQVALDDCNRFIINEVKKNGNILMFKMPSITNFKLNQVIVHVEFIYKQQLISSVPYVYNFAIDEALSLLHLSTSTDNDSIQSERKSSKNNSDARGKTTHKFKSIKRLQN